MNMVDPHKVTVKKFTEIPKSERSRYLRSIPLPTRLKTRLANHFDGWVRANGYLHAVSRMKSFREFVMASWAEHPAKLPNPGWFTTNQNGVLTGTFGSLFWLSKQSHSEFRAVLDLTGIYTSVRYSIITNEELEVELASVEEAGPKEPLLRTLKVKTLRDLVRRFRPPKLWCRKPTPLSMVPPGKLSHASVVPEDVQKVFFHWNFLDWRVRALIEEAIGAQPVNTPGMPFFGKPDTSVGSIQSTFEPGLKIRCFANPNKVMQRALEPLKEGLLSVVKGLPWDCTNDQRKADQVISQSLASGKIVYSIDLSSATDRFPYWFQKLCLESVMTLNSNSDIQEQRQVASKFLLDYIVEMGYFQTSIGLKTWRVGQPLGLDPSFPLFTLSHGILLLLLNRGAWNKQFYVVGDDVVIFNRALADSYRKLLTSWGIPVSEGKTFSSNRLAQFAGVTYTPYGSFWLPKWREFTRDTLIDIAAWWYPGFTKGLRDHELIVRVLSLPEPIGIGRNPLGLPISDRLTSALAYRLAEKEADREERSKPSHTREFASYPGEDNMVHSWKQDWKLLRSNRPVLISLAFDSLMDHTEVSGYPKVQLRTRGKRDPYTLGRTQYWNQLFQELEVLSEAVPSSTDR